MVMSPFTEKKQRAFAAVLCCAALALRPVESFSSCSTRDFRFTSTSRLLESSTSSGDGSEAAPMETRDRRRPRGWSGVGRWLRRKRGPKITRSEELYMVATPIALEKRTTPSIPDFILENMDKMSPDRVLPSSVSQGSLWNTGAELETVLVEERKDTTVAPDVDSPARGKQSLASKKAGYGPVGRVTRSFARNWLETALTERWTVVPPDNVSVDVTPLDNVWARITRGQYAGDVTMDYVGSLVFPTIQSSGGGAIRATNVCVNWGSSVNYNRRFAEPFELSFEDIVLTKEDWLESKCIRNGLARLLKRVVRKNTHLQPNEIQIQRLNILPDGKLSCEAIIKDFFLEWIPLEIRTGFDVQKRGHEVKLRGLELSCPKLPPTIKHDFSTVVLDIGHDAMLKRLTLDPAEQTLTLSGSVRIQPYTKPTLNHRQSRHSYYAHCFVDVGAWLSRIVENLNMPQPPVTDEAG